MHNQLVSMAASVEGGIIGEEGSLYRSNLRRELFSKRNEVSVKEAFSVLRSYYYFGVRRADTIEMSTDGRRRRTRTARPSTGTRSRMLWESGVVF